MTQPWGIDSSLPATEDADFAALAAFVLGNSELEELERLVARFNIFEALGVVRQELRHSDFLAFLLDPNEAHGLGDVFVRQFLLRIVQGSPRAGPRISIDIALRNLSGVTVRREWQNIDILLLDEANRTAVVIENKIGSGEHSEQLRRYRETVRHYYPTFEMYGVFLTPEGVEASDGEFASLGYDVIRQLIEDIVGRYQEAAPQPVVILLNHYVQMLRSHILTDPAIAELARQIYQKHRRALDLIFEYRPDRQQTIRDYLELLISSTPGLVPDQSSKMYLRFAPRDWDNLPQLFEGSGWTASHRMLLFQFNNEAQSLHLGLHIGPGPLEIRQRLLELALELRPPFHPRPTKLLKYWNQIYIMPFLDSSTLLDASDDEVREKIDQSWRRFLSDDLPVLTATVSERVSRWGPGADISEGPQ